MRIIVRVSDGEPHGAPQNKEGLIVHSVDMLWWPWDARWHGDLNCTDAIISAWTVFKDAHLDRADLDNVFLSLGSSLNKQQYFRAFWVCVFPADLVSFSILRGFGGGRYGDGIASKDSMECCLIFEEAIGW
jgi:hypothetical protein